MESNIAHSGQLYSVLGWLDKNRKQILMVATVALVGGLIWWYVKCAHDEKEIAAGEALSALLLGASEGPAPADALIKIGNDFAGTKAGARALLSAATQQFVDGKTDDSLSSFRRVVSEYGGTPLEPQAMLGIATCLQSLGKTGEATTAYKEVVDRFPNANTITPAKFALARLYESEGKIEQARDFYLDLQKTADPQGTIGMEVSSRLMELTRKNPKPAPITPAPGTNAPKGNPAK